MTGAEPLDGNENGNGYGRLAKTITTLGVSSVIALGLVWFIAVRLDGRMSRQEEKLQGLIDYMNVHAMDSSNNKLQLETITRVLRQMCMNDARTEYARASCLQ